MAFVMGMINRNSKKDSLDFFPTCPWATRALFEHVISISRNDSVLEPACGMGHMAEVIKEYSDDVDASDIYNYGYGDCIDYFAGYGTQGYDWVITNPPFNHAVDFTLKAIDEAKKGVAMLCRTQWLEGKGRYEKLFQNNPPNIFAPFCERVPMVKGRWDPTATTPMSYSWFVWDKSYADKRLTRTVWIPPGQRKLLTKDDDVLKFGDRICIN